MNIPRLRHLPVLGLAVRQKKAGFDSMSKHAHDPEHTSFMDNFSFGADGHSIVGPSEENMDTRGIYMEVRLGDGLNLPSVLPQARMETRAKRELLVRFLYLSSSFPFLPHSLLAK